MDVDANSNSADILAKTICDVQRLLPMDLQDPVYEVILALQQVTTLQANDTGSPYNPLCVLAQRTLLRLC